jgi:hypothetical protein
MENHAMSGNVRLLSCLMLLTAASAAAVEPANAGRCVLSADNRVFLDEALGAWERAHTQLLRVESDEFPWSVVFDTKCTWHLGYDPERLKDAQRMDRAFTVGGRSVPVAAVSHGDTVELPDGQSIPARGVAFTSLYDDEEKPFFVMALLDVWRQQPAAAKHPDLRHIILGVVSHEMAHTLQLPAVARRIHALGERFDLPENVNDDIVEDRFSGNEAYSKAFDREVDAFYEAFRANDPVKRRALVRRGLAMARARQAKYFTGEDAMYAPLEGLFLNMEGVGTWVSYKLGYSTETGKGLERARNNWSQDEGLVLMLLVSELVPDWRKAVLEDLVSPFDLLKESVR